MSTVNILIVEDESDIRELMVGQLQQQGYVAIEAITGEEAIEKLQSGQSEYQLIILDRMLPGVDGIEVCRFIRLYRPTKLTPILMITALAQPENIIEGLDAGADDYVTKPFDLDVLLARVRTLLRRHATLKPVVSDNNGPSLPQKHILTVGGILVNTHKCEVKNESGEEISLTATEYKILCILAESKKVMTRKQLIEQIQDDNVHVTERTIDTHVFALRKKLGDHSNMIETIRGIGYRIND